MIDLVVEKRYSELERIAQKEILRKNFKTALRYSKVKVFGVSLADKIENTIMELGLGLLPYRLNKEGKFRFNSSESSKDVESIATYYLQKERDAGHRKMLEDTLKKMKLITHATPGEKTFYVDYANGKTTIYGGDEFELTALLTNQKLEERLKLMEELHRMDGDLSLLDTEEIRLKNVFGPDTDSCFQVDYILEKYFEKKEEEFPDFLAYLKKQILWVEQHNTNVLDQTQAIEEMHERLMKSGKVAIISERIPPVLMYPEEERKSE